MLLPLHCAWSQEELQSTPDDAQRLFVMARDLWAPVELQSFNYTTTRISNAEAQYRLRQACIFLETAVEMDKTNSAAWLDLVSLYTSPIIDDPGRALGALIQYSRIIPEDQVPVETWIRYRLNSLSERKEREYFLRLSLSQMRSYPYVQSEILEELAILALEKGDKDGARGLFSQAASASVYNYDALARLFEIGLPKPPVSPQDTPEIIEARQKAVNLQIELQKIRRWRLKLHANPYDLQAALNLIDTLESYGLDKLAQNFYPHVFRLFKLIPPQPNLLGQMQLKQLVGLYKLGEYKTCVRTAGEILKERPDDLLINGIMGMALQKLGLPEEANQVLDQAVKKSVNALYFTQPGIIASQPSNVPAQGYQTNLPAELAWFFCFIKPQPLEALKYAQDSYQRSDANPRALHTVAYALNMNNQFDQAEELLKSSKDPNDPIAALAWTGILLKRNDKNAALKRLQDVNLNRAGILADTIQDKIKELSPPPPQPETAAPDAPPAPSPADNITRILQTEFDDKELLLPDKPQDYVYCCMRFNADTFNYGDPILIQIYLTNISESNLQFGPGCFLDPHVFIVAEVMPTGLPETAIPRQSTSPQSKGTLIPLVHRYLNQNPVLAPGRSNVVTECLNVGQFRQTLQQHPQQTYQITFRMFLDPVINPDGTIVGRIAQLQPKPVTVIRRGFSPTRNRLSAQEQFITSGTAQQRIQATNIISGLIQEAGLSQNGTLTYRSRPIDIAALWGLLPDNLNYTDPRVKGWCAYALGKTGLTPQASATHQLVTLLEDKNWFVRLMSTQALVSVADLTEYLRWSNITDENEIVKRQAQFYLQKPWEVIEIPMNIPEEQPKEDTEKPAGLLDGILPAQTPAPKPTETAPAPTTPAPAPDAPAPTAPAPAAPAPDAPATPDLTNLFPDKPAPANPTPPAPTDTPK